MASVQESACLESCGFFLIIYISEAQDAWLIWKLPEQVAADWRLQQGISLQSFPPPLISHQWTLSLTSNSTEARRKQILKIL